jgi:FkbM family methyltransferase
VEIVATRTRAALCGLLLVVLAASSACRREQDILATGEKLYSQFDEELVIRDFFQDRRDGFFVDVGCGPPIVHSTTFYLEKHLGWSGIGIDAIAEYAPEWEKKRPRSRFFSFIVTDHSDTLDPFYRSGIEGLSSTQQHRPFLGSSGSQLRLEGEEIQLPTITLDKLLDAQGVEEVDFVSMDIEDSEPEALAGFDVERFAPELVCIEAAIPTRERILEYFRSHDYVLIERYLEADPVNWYFTPKH